MDRTIHLHKLNILTVVLQLLGDICMGKITIGKIDYGNVKVFWKDVRGGVFLKC